ncbi:MAG: ABC transporter ATP-binding protein [Anaerolineales bacterium]|nr:ABC transporter ATP-binding protein [Anaerolineales bacterium]
MINFQNVGFTYPNSSKPALRNISFTLNRGEMVLVTGVSGSGKSTLLRCINGLVPHFSGGMISGKIMVDGHDPVKESPKALCQVVGFVFQDPESQFVMDQVEAEIAFVLENFALPPEEIQKRLDSVLSLLKLENFRGRPITSLSGGEQQRIAIASVLTLKPSILILDEPTSQLDPASAENLLQVLKDLNKNNNLTIILSEHRLERVIPYADRVIHLGQQGFLKALGHPRDVFQKIGVEVPLIEMAKKLKWESVPLSVEEARNYAREYRANSKIGIENQASINGKNHIDPHNDSKPAVKTLKNPPFIQVTDLGFSYNGVPALLDVNLDIQPGETVVLMGENGAGKSTLLRCIVGLLKPQQGKIFLNGEDICRKSVAGICKSIAYLPQDPNMMLFADHVEDELKITLQNHRLDNAPISPQKLLFQLGLAGKAHRYPRDLSTGERQRVALGAVLVTQPGAILLDEPTRGLDYAAKKGLKDLLKDQQSEGKAILLITHDVEFAAQIADRVIILDTGKIIKQGSPKEIFSSFPPFITQISQVFPDSGWITPQDIEEIR